MLKVRVAHDITCPYCWVAWKQVQRMRAEFEVEVEWLPFELWPAELPRPEPKPDPIPLIVVARRPSPLQHLLKLDGLELPRTERPKGMSVNPAFQALEFARDHSAHDALLDRLYAAFWELGEDISKPEVLARLAEGLVEPKPMLDAVAEKRYRERIVPFDDEAYSRGVAYVPTFWIGDEALAERPYTELRAALLRHAKPTGGAIGDLYSALNLPDPPPDRPTTFINMVSTIDGKILTGERDEPVMDLGSAVDHQGMKRLRAAADAVLVGSGTVRATPRMTFGDRLIRYVATARGGLDWSARVFTEAPAYLVVAGDGDPNSPLPTLRGDWPSILRTMRQEHGVRRLLIEGGSELNAELLRAGLVDDLFLTLAPKIKLGRQVPTYAGGDPLPREEVQNFRLVEHRAIGDELFLHYRRNRA